MGWPFGEPLDEEDAFEEILSWLPPADLLRYKSVNKSWHSKITSLINYKPFALKQARNSNNRLISASTTLVFRRGRAYPNYRSFDHERTVALLTVFHGQAEGAKNSRGHCETQDLQIPSLEEEEFDTGSAWFYRHCNGIVCLVDKYGVVLLFNPEIRQHRIVPKTNFDLSLCVLNTYEYNEKITQGLGFGYDSKACEYKIVMMFSSYKTETVWTPGAEVYDLSTNSWRVISCREDNMPDNFHWGLDKGVYCNGFYYWLVKGLGHKKVVLSFDFQNEVFLALPLPPLPSCPHLNLTVEWTSAAWKDSLILFSSYAVEDKSPEMRCVDVWEMDSCFAGVEGAASSSYWRKCFSVGPFKKLEAPLALLTSDEIVLAMQNGAIATCNLRTERLNWLDVDKDDCMDYWGSYVKTVSSLEN